jgi:hypothetical protein
MSQTGVNSKQNSPAKEDISVKRKESPKKNLICDNNLSRREITFEISDIEIQRIIENQRKFEKEKRDQELMSTKYFFVESDKIVEKVSKDIVYSLVRKVCNEILDSNLIVKLINLELKE